VCVGKFVGGWGGRGGVVKLYASYIPNVLLNRIGGVTVSVLVSSAVDRGCEPRSGQTKDYKIGTCCFSAKHAALRRNIKDWSAWNQNIVSEWSDMSIHGL
jgi:hypothetical protein